MGTTAMIVAVASGKGGTGKTTVAVSLALALAESEDGAFCNGARPLLLDCDVEAPNAALFLPFEAVLRRDAVQPVPEVDPRRCSACGRCAEVCAFRAIAVVKEQVLTFPELCHGCGSCRANCPTEAIAEEDNVQGTLESGSAGGIDLAQGRIHVGVAMPVPTIRQLKHWALPAAVTEDSDRPVIIDSPPGTSCPVVETVRGSDFVLLVTEPTPFGLHDLRLAVEVIRDELRLPIGVLVNRDGTGFAGVNEYCESAGVPVLLRIPHDRRIAEAYAEGEPLVRAVPESGARFRALYASIRDLCEGRDETDRHPQR
jgi:MinD superfamily P-loop ATPase